IEAKRIAVVILGSFLLAVSLNFFLINANVYASGFSGFAQLLSSVFKDFLQIQVSTGVLVCIFDVPVLIRICFKVGNGFTLVGVLHSCYPVFLKIFYRFK